MYNTYIQGAEGKICIYMGVYGCGWVRWGAGARAGTKTRQAEPKMGVQGVVLALWPGEISPNITFCDGRQKVARMGAGG